MGPTIVKPNASAVFSFTLVMRSAPAPVAHSPQHPRHLARQRLSGTAVPSDVRMILIESEPLALRALTAQDFLQDNERVLITFSAGVTQLQAKDDYQNALIRADKAVYMAKKAGKNRVFFAE